MVCLNGGKTIDGVILDLRMETGEGALSTVSMV